MSDATTCKYGHPRAVYGLVSARFPHRPYFRCGKCLGEYRVNEAVGRAERTAQRKAAKDGR